MSTMKWLKHTVPFGYDIDAEIHKYADDIETFSRLRDEAQTTEEEDLLAHNIKIMILIHQRLLESRG